jgi:hypothetical protein
VDTRLVPILLVCQWVQVALGLHRRRQALGEEGDTGQANIGVDYVRLLAQHEATLFGGSILGQRCAS